MSEERRRRLARERQRRLRERRVSELAERKDIIAEKRAESLRKSHPDLYAIITGPEFTDAWHFVYGKAPPDLTQHPVDVIEYTLEILADDRRKLN